MEDKLNLKSSSYAILVVLVSLIAVILSGFLLIKPLLDDNNAQQKVIEQKRADLNVYKDKEDKLKELSDKKQEIKDDSKAVLAAIPDHEDKDRLFVQFEKLASSSGLYLDSLAEKEVPSSSSKGSSARNKSQAPEGVSKLNYVLNLKGNYEGFKNFLANSEKALSILEITRVEIKQKENQNLDITLYLSAFYKKDSGDTNENK